MNMYSEYMQPFYKYFNKSKNLITLVVLEKKNQP